MATTFRVVKNNASSSLAGAVDGVTDPVTFSVAAGEGLRFPSTFPFHVSIDNEILSCTTRTVDSLTCARAAEGTTIASHSSAAGVVLNVTAQSVTDLNTAVNALEVTAHTQNTDLGTSNPYFYIDGTTSGDIRLKSDSGLQVRGGDDSGYVGLTAATIVSTGNLNVLGDGSLIFSTQSAADNDILQAKINGDDEYRFTAETDGTLGWGPGDDVCDVTLTRSAAGVLAVRNLADSGYETIRGDTPAGANDLTTKSYVDGLGSTLYQPLDADLTTLAGLTRTRGDVLVGGAAAWTDLAIGTTGKFFKSDGTDPSWQNVLSTDLSDFTTAARAAITVTDSTSIDFTYSGGDITGGVPLFYRKATTPPSPLPWRLTYDEATTNLFDIDTARFQASVGGWLEYDSASGSGGGTSTLTRETTSTYIGEGRGQVVVSVAGSTDCGARTGAISVAISTRYVASVWLKGNTSSDVIVFAACR